MSDRSREFGEEAEGKKRDEVELVTEAAASDIYLG